MIQLLTEKGLLRAVAKTREMSQMTELEFQFQMKKLEIEERERQEQREAEEKEREGQFQREEKEREFKRQKEFAEKEREERDKEREKAEKQRQFKLRELEIKGEQAEKESKIVRKDQVARSMSLVPRFDEKEIEKYFLMFEKVAESMEWPKDMYCLFLQGVLTGKAKNVYCALSTEQCANYEFVKETILQAYELVPEDYRQRFRNLVKL